MLQLPETIDETDAAKIATAIRILGMTAKGYTVKEACEEQGMSTATYYRWLRKGGDAIEALRTFMVESEREQLGQILAARQHALDRIVERVETEPSLDLILKADEHLRKLQRELEDRHGAHGIDDTAAQEFVLSGPSMKTEKSRLVSVNVTISEEQPPVVIDAEDAEFEDNDG